MSETKDFPKSDVEMVPKYLLDAAKSVLADREKELLELKGPCTTEYCRLHRAHSGICHIILPGVNDA